MARVVVTALADADTAKVLDDLAGDAGPLVASNYNARIEALYDRLAYAPDGYQERLARRAQSLIAPLATHRG